MSFSFVNSCSLLQSKHWKEQFDNILDATKGGFGIHTKGSMPIISSTCVHIMHEKEQVCNINMATQISKLSVSVQTKHWKEQVFIKFVATQNILIIQIMEHSFYQHACKETIRKSNWSICLIRSMEKVLEPGSILNSPLSCSQELFLSTHAQLRLTL